MTIRSPKLADPSARLPADLPVIDGVGLRRPPQGAPEEIRVGAVPGSSSAVARSDHDGARAAYPLALPPPPHAPADALAHLRETAQRLATSPTAELAALRAADPALAAALDPLLAAERALANRLVRLVALREVVDAMRRVSLGEPR